MAHKAGFKRRKLSLTSLIDVIFLLLLFFMLSSTFSRYAEVELATAGAGPASDDVDARPVFIQLRADVLRLNAREITLDDLPAALDELVQAGSVRGLISTNANVTAQRLADLLVTLRAVEGLKPEVLTPS